MQEPFQTDPQLERDRRRRDLALGYNLFAKMRWGDLGEGHITARDPVLTDHFWLLAFGVDFGTATVDDTVLVGPDGSIVNDDRSINITAFHIHHPIHAARPDVIAAAHVHTAYGTPFSTERRVIPPTHQEATVFFEDTALFDDEEVQILGLDGGERIAKALGDASFAILANHGLLTTGPSVATAIAQFVLMERACETVMKAPGAIPITDTAARVAKAALRHPDMAWQSWQFLLQRHLSF